MRGKDYEFEGTDAVRELNFFKDSKLRGVGIYTHANPSHRPASIYGGTTTLYAGGNYASYVLLPVIP